jgi:SAM-dependent methyltransferase
VTTSGSGGGAASAPTDRYRTHIPSPHFGSSSVIGQLLAVSGEARAWLVRFRAEGCPPRLLLANVRAALEVERAGVALTRRRAPFSFERRSYAYEMGWHNNSWANERSVEIPIFRDLLARHGGEPLLEVGNVLSHYVRHAHAIVDKYDREPGVINQDILEYDPPGSRFDLVLSISTLEHVGFDEPDRQPEKFDRALDRIRALLAPHGEAWFSVPLGYNPVVDRHAFSASAPYDRFYLRRESLENTWRQCSAADVEGVRYGSPYPWANAVMIGHLLAGGSGREANLPR